jgi:hypothetical protein
MCRRCASRNPVKAQAPEGWNMKSECDFYLDRAAKCLAMAEHVDEQYRGDLVRIAQRWVQLAQEEAEWEAEPGESAPALALISADPNHA